MPNATALSMLEGPPLVWAGQTALKFYGRTLVDEDYNGLALDEREGDRIAAALGEADIVFMKNHGVMVVGPSVAEAWDDLYYLERAAEVQRLAPHKAIPGNRPSNTLVMERISPRRLGALIREHFTLAPDCEFGVEIDPRRITPDHIAALREIGANRASLGVQDTNPRVQLAIHRIQPHHLNKTAVRWLRAEGFESINVDLIYGLPLQTPETYAKTIEDVLGLNPDRLSVFSYAHVPWIKP
eukprot:gene7753-9591_t